MDSSNLDFEELQNFARDAASFATHGALSRLEFALNARGQPDVAVFDFTRMFAAMHASRILESRSFRLLQVLVGDSLLEVSLYLLFFIDIRHSN
ncbi:unnamed protein product [Protopolystoma xenopodis]|uniref:[F-actin]-monooxygenase MICAL1-3-like Rossman domain-containing protein n=1 Tax=Protopolystoma xenopodis TaxID=117903 RepID=A0A448WZD7_9PLAT|nr:unnamed protein product [Protopolystoma xenopodis]